MQETMLKLYEQIQGCVLGYTQSDEITLVLVDYQRRESMAWFDNQVQKICSVAASIATSAFNKAILNILDDLDAEMIWMNENGMEESILELKKKRELLESKLFSANFDARAFNIPQHEVINNLIWRQQDATRNSILSLGQSLFPHKELQGIKCNELQNKMLVEKDVNWNNKPTIFKRGSCAIKDNEGKWFIDMNIPIFTEDRDYINRLVYIEE